MAICERKSFEKRSLGSLWSRSVFVLLFCAVVLRTSTVAQDLATTVATDLTTVYDNFTTVQDNVTTVQDVLTTVQGHPATDPVIPLVDPNVICNENEKSKIKIRFNITEPIKPSIQFEKQLADNLSNAIQNDCVTVEFETFSPGTKNTFSVTMNVNITGETSMRQDVIRTIYRIIMEEGSLAGYSVSNLLIDDGKAKRGARGTWKAYCTIVDESRCPYGMNCRVSKEDECYSVCEDNKGYCQNGGSCIELKNSKPIQCSCTKDVTGDRCENAPILSAVVRYFLIAVACLLALILLIILLCCLIMLCRPKRKSSRGLYGVENVVALHSLNDEVEGVGGVAIQTDDSYLRNRSNDNGVPPKPGYTHQMMQTNESFLLARAQNPKIAQVKAQPHQSKKGAPGKAVNGESTASTPSPVNNKPTPAPALKVPKPSPEVTVQTGDSLPRNIVKV